MAALAAEWWQRSADTDTHADATPDPSPLTAHVILHHVSKQRNAANIVACAAAFGFPDIVSVGKRKGFLDALLPALAQVVRLARFDDMPSAVAHLRALPGGCCIVGIEIAEDAVPAARLTDAVQRYAAPLNGGRPVAHVAFLPGNEGAGLSAQERGVCDFLVYVPQFDGACGGTGSMNVNTAVAVVLHQFAAQNRRAA